jgi:chaperonin cofactor prefoldin
VPAELDEAHQEIQHMLEEKQHLAKELKLAKDALAQAERNQTSNSNVREPVSDILSM